MKQIRDVVWVILMAAIACSDKSAVTSGDADILSPVPEGAQALSLLGQPLGSTTPPAQPSEKYIEAKKNFKADPSNPDNIIWFGRWTAYSGNHREAIRIYTEGIKKFPADARFYRHRGHRYITLREFDRAIRDFEKAAEMIKGTKDEIEPDGQPNAQNTPVSSLHSNIYYHLALAYYLKNDMENALRVTRIGLAASANDDKIVSTMHWLYMILRRLGREDEAKRALEPIRVDMNIIENQAYHQLCLFYKGEFDIDKLTGGSLAGSSGDAVTYGLANWHLYNGRKNEAKAVYKKILDSPGWASFGYIAAEADWAREFPGEPIK